MKRSSLPLMLAAALSTLAALPLKVSAGETAVRPLLPVFKTAAEVDTFCGKGLDRFERKHRQLCCPAGGQRQPGTVGLAGYRR